MSASLVELALRLVPLALSKRATQSTKLTPMSASSAELALRLVLLALLLLNNFAYAKKRSRLNAKAINGSFGPRIAELGLLCFFR